MRANVQMCRCAMCDVQMCDVRCAMKAIMHLRNTFQQHIGKSSDTFSGLSAHTILGHEKTRVMARLRREHQRLLDTDIIPDCPHPLNITRDRTGFGNICRFGYETAQLDRAFESFNVDFHCF